MAGELLLILYGHLWQSLEHSGHTVDIVID